MIDLTEEENFDFDVISAILSRLPGNTEFIVCQIEKYKCDKTTFDYLYFDVNDLYENLNRLIQSSDCKNGCQYDTKLNEFYILGSLAHFPDIYNTKYVTQDKITIRFKKSKVCVMETLEELMLKKLI